ncbi:hypothetical protein [Pantoea ananatis]|uniref:hypothetical protein n=1 Tax=Pantoea ananas TaxID=553 RepID=UPI001C893D0E|nr:hypothetical protein [Pantoea ananatis]QZE30680.1 hypothetical protein K4732_07965 [Pantoea ananatis]
MINEPHSKHDIEKKDNMFKRTIGLTLLTVFFLYNVKFVFLDGIGSFYIVSLLFFLAFLSSYRKENFKFNTNSLKISCVWMFFSFFSILKNIDNFDPSFFKFIILIPFVLMITPYIVEKMNASPGEILKIIGLATFLNAIVMIVMFLSIDIRNFYLSFLQLEVVDVLGKDALKNLLSLRLIGINGFSAYATAFIQITGAILYYIYVTEFTKTGKLKLRNYLVIFIVIISSLIAARSSIAGIIALMAIMLCDAKNYKKNWFYLVLFFVILTLLFGLISVLLPPKIANFFTGWALEFFNSGLKSGSLQKNLEMYVYSLSDFTILGDGRLTNGIGGYYKETDVGYFRLLFSSGILGCLLMLATLFVVLNPFKLRKIKNSFYLFVNLMLSIIFMFKGFIIYDAFICFFMYLSLNLTLTQKEINDSRCE